MRASFGLSSAADLQRPPRGNAANKSLGTPVTEFTDTMPSLIISPGQSDSHSPEPVFKQLYDFGSQGCRFETFQVQVTQGDRLTATKGQTNTTHKANYFILHQECKRQLSPRASAAVIEQRTNQNGLVNVAHFDLATEELKKGIECHNREGIRKRWIQAEKKDNVLDKAGRSPIGRINL
jgi:hypothetical protein